MNARLSNGMAGVRRMLGGFTPGQRGVILVVSLALVLGLVGLTRWASQPTWTPLFSNLSGTDANAIVEQLRSQNVQYQLADGGGTVLVPQSQVYDLRIALSGKGLPSSSSNGYSILDQQGMTATDFQQNIAYQRALESELSRTLQAMDGVQTALVHIAIPQRTVFTTQQDQPTASVLLGLQPGTTLAREQVRAVTHLVAGSVPGLSPSNVTLTDAQGNLLSVPETGADAQAMLASQTDQQTAEFEQRMNQTVQQMLDRVLGPNHAVVRVNAQLNFDTRATTSEQYVSPTGSLPPLSEVTAHETYSGIGAGPGGQLGGVWPTLTPIAGGTGGSYDSQARTVDNPVNKIVSSAQAAPGSVQRLTVAVALDAASAGKISTAQIQALVSNAVGIDPARGDSVQVTSLPFDTTAAAAAAKEVATAQASQRMAGYLDLAKKAGLALLVAIVLLVAMRRRKKAKPSVEVYASDLAHGSLLGGLPPALSAGPTGAHAFGGQEGAAAALPEQREAAEDLARRRERLRDEVTRLVDNQPEEVAQVIQGWLSQRKS